MYKVKLACIEYLNNHFDYVSFTRFDFNGKNLVLFGIKDMSSHSYKQYNLDSIVSFKVLECI